MIYSYVTLSSKLYYKQNKRNEIALSGSISATVIRQNTLRELDTGNYSITILT